MSVLVNAQPLKAMRTHRERAIDERYCGRTARIFRVATVSPTDGDATPYCNNDLATAAISSSSPTHAVRGEPT